MFVYGGRGKNPAKKLELDVFETDKSIWTKYECEQRYRHGLWVSDSALYVFGGFERLYPAFPTDTLVKLELGEIFLENEPLLMIILEHVIEQNNQQAQLAL